MKKIILLMLFFPLGVMSQNPLEYSGVLKATVTGNSVTLAEDTAMRNCGALYTMQAWLKGDTLYWYQIDTGESFACSCWFNLSLTVDSLQPGHYTTKVFYTEFPDWPPPYPITVYSGLVPFEITEQNASQSIQLMDAFQSECFTNSVQVSENESVLAVSVFPNPVQEVLHLKRMPPEQKSIALYDLQGRRLYHINTNQTSMEIDVINFENGIYLLTIENGTRKEYIKVVKSR
jgi:hypothetical protein